jgi:hypothetical protein
VKNDGGRDVELDHDRDRDRDLDHDRDRDLEEIESVQGRVRAMLVALVRTCPRSLLRFLRGCRRPSRGS